MQSKKRFAIGRSDYEAIIKDNMYYVDKTLFIKEIIDTSADVILLPRPRRFGKTLNLSMLRYFFEKGNKDNSCLFKDFKIWQEENFYKNKQGKYPVIYLTFKDVKQLNWQSCLNKLKLTIVREYRKASYLIENNVLDKFEKKDFNDILDKTASQESYENSLNNLIEYLNRYHQQKVIVLIDEYDTPIHAGYFKGYYEDVVNFMREFLGGGLKDNANLEKGVITGILRVAKESIFSGLNNLGVYSLLKSEFSDSFGFSIKELQEVLKYYDLQNRFEEINRWYNGYIFGGKEVFNPWSIINYVESKDKLLEPYWANTSSNDLIQKLITEGDDEFKNDIEILITKGSINKAVTKDIVFPDLENRDDIVWSFLLFTGYLKARNVKPIEEMLYYDLSIPNKEVSFVYKQVIKNWLNSGYKSPKLKRLLKSLVTGDIKYFETMFNDFVINMMSYYDIGADESERVYQAFILGMLVNLSENYHVKSNRESGYGRYDVMIIPRDIKNKGIVIEFKKLSKLEKETAGQALERALSQIKERHYSEELREKGIKEIIELGIVFDGKRVWVREQVK